MVRRWVYRIHLLLGLSVGLYLVLMGLTGSLITFRDELDAAMAPGLFHCPRTPGDTTISLDVIRDACGAVQPDLTVNRIKIPAEPTEPFIVRLRGQGTTAYAFIHPVTGQVLGVRSEIGSLMDFAYTVHHDLLLGQTGATISTWLSVAGLVLLVTGIWIWWPKTWTLLKQGLSIQRGATLRRRMHDLHNVFGMYSLPLLAIVILTGTMILWPKPFDAAIYWVTGSKAEEPFPKVTTLPTQTPLAWDVLLDRAIQSLDENAQPGFVFPAQKPGAPYRVLFYRGDRNYFSMHVDPYTGNRIGTTEHTHGSTAQWTLSWVSPLHYGTWGGTASRVLNVFLGLVPAVLFVTGLIKWRMKVNGRKSNAERRAAAPNNEPVGALS